MPRPRVCQLKGYSDEALKATYEQHQSLAKAAAALGISEKTMKREFHRMGMVLERGRHIDLPLMLTRRGARSLPDLRDTSVVMKTSDGFTIAGKDIGAYTIVVSKHNPDHIRVDATLKDGREVEVLTSVQDIKSSLGLSGMAPHSQDSLAPRE